MQTIITIKLVKPNGGPIAFRCHLIAQGEGLPFLVEYKDSEERVTLPSFEAPPEFTKIATQFLNDFGEHIVKAADLVVKSSQLPDGALPQP